MYMRIQQSLCRNIMESLETLKKPEKGKVFVFQLDIFIFFLHILQFLKNTVFLFFWSFFEVFFEVFFSLKNVKNVKSDRGYKK